MGISATFRIVAVTMALAGPIWAEASDSGAARLKAALQTYLGAAEGVVGVAVAGDDYAVTIDVTPLMAGLAASDMTASASPIVARVTDNGDGTWGFVIDQPFAMDYGVEGLISSSSSYEALKSEGVFDEALGDFSSYKVDITGLKTTQTRPSPMMGEMTAQSTTESLVWEGSAVAGAGGLDGNFNAITSGMVFDVALPTGEGMPPMQLSGSIAAGATSGAILGYQPKAIYALIAWLVAHPSERLVEAGKAELKPLIEAALPIFSSASIEGSYSTISVASPMGIFALGDAGFALDMGGVVPEGRLREAITLRGLTLPEGMVPPFAMALVPQEIAIDVTVSRFDPAAAVQVALGMMDLPDGTPLPEGFDMQMLMALMPEGAVDITLAPGGMRNTSYDLSYEGAMSAGMGGMPTGSATLTLAGIDAIMAALAAAPPEMAGQVLPFVGMAQAMGQPGPDGALVWQIDASTPGSLLINGMDMMGMQ